MGRNFPSRRILHRYDVWRDRRRFPWRYPEHEARWGGRQHIQNFRRRFFVMRSVENDGRLNHYIVAECPSYAAAMEVAALHGDRVFTEGQMLDHTERRRAFSAWDKGDGRQLTRRTTPHRVPSRSTSDTFSSVEAHNG